MRWVFEQDIDIRDDVEREDGGAAVILTLIEQTEPTPDSPDHGLFVRVQSWDGRRNSPLRHRDIQRILAARRVRVTIEIEE